MGAIMQITKALAFLIILLSSASAQELELPLSRLAQPILIPVGLSGGDALFMVDTGAASSWADIAIMPLIDPSLVGAGRGPVVRRVPTRVTMGGTAISIENLAFHNLQAARDAQNFPMMGIIGMDVLKKQVLTLDFDRSLARLTSKAPPEFSNAQSVPIKFGEDGRPLVPFRLGKSEIDCLIDLGSMHGFTLDSRKFDVTPFAGTLRYAMDAYATSTGVESGNWMALVDPVEFGETKSGATYVRRGKPTESSKVGLLFLCRYNLCFDFANAKLYYTKSTLFDGRDSSDRAGLSFRSYSSSDGTVGGQVLFVEANSDGAKAGVRPGDIAIKIELGPELAFTGDAVYRALALPRPPGSKLRVIRDGRTIDLELPGP